MATESVAKNPSLPTRIPSLAPLLSLLWPGLGQVYNGQVRKGVTLMALYVMSLFLTFVSPIGFATAAVLLVYSVVNAYRVATYYDQWIGGPQKRCTKCGESIQALAESCRFCGCGFRHAT